MAELTGEQLWKKILLTLEEQMQFGFLEQAKSVRAVEMKGGELLISVFTREAIEFFSSEVNQQRLQIISRPLIAVESVTVIECDEPAELLISEDTRVDEEKEE